MRNTPSYKQALYSFNPTYSAGKRQRETSSTESCKCYRLKLQHTAPGTGPHRPSATHSRKEYFARKRHRKTLRVESQAETSTRSVPETELCRPSSSTEKFGKKDLARKCQKHANHHDRITPPSAHIHPPPFLPSIHLSVYPSIIHQARIAIPGL